MPSREEFRKLWPHWGVVPVFREVPVDTETPISIYLKLAGDGDSFLLESAEGAERWGRYSFIGTGGMSSFRVTGGVTTYGERELTGNPFSALKGILEGYKAGRVEGLPGFWGGLVGYVGYDMARYIEHLPVPRDNLEGIPDCYLLATDSVVIFDHLKHSVKVVHASPSAGGEPDDAYDRACGAITRIIGRIRRRPRLPASAEGAGGMVGAGVGSNMGREEFKRAVLQAKSHIAAGDIFQVVLSKRFECSLDAHPFDVYRMLRRLNPSPYMYFLKLGGVSLIGSSPEVLVKLEGRRVYTRPIAGTRRRGRTGAEDRVLEEELLSDEKERAEHVMLVDLGRNDLGRICKYGTVQVSDFMRVERYSHVMHLVSEVVGELRNDRDAVDAFCACFPAGTVTGAPKIRAMELIAELERTRRGPYAGAVGYFGYSGDMDTCITIRTVVVHHGMAYVQAGAGIVADSVPENEHRECSSKAMALLEALGAAEGDRSKGGVVHGSGHR